MATLTSRPIRKTKEPQQQQQKPNVLQGPQMPSKQERAVDAEPGVKGRQRRQPGNCKVKTAEGAESERAVKGVHDPAPNAEESKASLLYSSIRPGPAKDGNEPQVRPELIPDNEMAVESGFEFAENLKDSLIQHNAPPAFLVSPAPRSHGSAETKDGSLTEDCKAEQPRFLTPRTTQMLLAHVPIFKRNSLAVGEDSNDLLGLDFEPQEVSSAGSGPVAGKEAEGVEKKETIGPQSFVAHKLLGKGSFGEVYLVEKLSNKTLYAMKVLSKEKILSQNLVKYALTERKVLSAVNHPFIVRLYYAFQSASRLYLVLEYCHGGDLSEYLRREKKYEKC